MQTYPFSEMEKYANHVSNLNDRFAENIPEGKRNNALASLAGNMRRCGMAEGEIEVALNAANDNRCKPPLPANEIRTIAKSISRYPSAPDTSLQDSENPSKGNRNNVLPPELDDSSTGPTHVLPTVVLFKDGTGVKINDTAQCLGKIYSKTERLFSRITGSDKEQQIQILDKGRNLQIISPAKFCSEVETVANIITKKNDKVIPAILKESDAKRILSCENFSDRLPPLNIVTRCPVIVEMPNGKTKVITRYDRTHGIYAMGEKPLEVDIDHAREIILESIAEFDFKSPSDKARAVASFITPGLVMGDIANFRSPIDLVEADNSQAGKGYKAKISAAYYNEIPFAINQQHGGVGSLEESLNQALIEGRIFITIDNLTPVKNGVFNSEKLCSFMTEDSYYARMLRYGMFINPRLHIIQMTTNGCALSKDLMNRASPVGIMKRNRFVYRKYPEGSILDHIRQNQGKFLGAVFSVIKEWCRRGKPMTTTTAHDSSFTPWAQSLDWIVQNIMRQAPLLDGYEQVRDRIISPSMQTLRDIALVIVKSSRTLDWVTASDIIEIVGPEGVDLPGTVAGYNFETMTDGEKDNVKRQLGASFRRAFDRYGSDNVLVIDGMRIRREEKTKTYDYGVTKDIKFYNFCDANDNTTI